MLGDKPIMAFAATADSQRARAFYEGVLGLRLVADEQYALVFDANGTMLRVQKVAAVSVAPYTALGWRVEDIEATARTLGAAGVSCEHYDFLPQDELGIWTTDGARVAWFKDPDGNLLSLTQFN